MPRQGEVPTFPRTKTEEQNMLDLAIGVSIEDARQHGIPVEGHSSQFSASGDGLHPHRTDDSQVGMYLSNPLSPTRPRTAQEEALEKLVTDCQILREKADKAISYREQCRKLGTMADEIAIAAKEAVRKVHNEDSALRLSKLLSTAHTYVYQGGTLIDVHGMYTKPKKYVKMMINAAASHKLKLDQQYEQLCIVHQQLWDMAELLSEGRALPTSGRHDTTSSSLDSHTPPSKVGGQLDAARMPLKPGQQISSAAERVSGGGSAFQLSTSSAVGMRSHFRTFSGRTLDTSAYRGTGRQSSARKLHGAGRWITKPVTCLLYLDDGKQDGRDGGVVWWWSQNAMHEHDINNMTTRKFEAKLRNRTWAPVKALAFDLSCMYVWAGHEDGTVSIWRESTGVMLTTSGSEVTRTLRDVKVIEPIGPFRVAVAGENGQVLLLRLDGWAKSGAASKDDPDDPEDAAHDGKSSNKPLDIVEVNKLKAGRRAVRDAANPGVNVVTVSSEDNNMCAPPVHAKRNVIKSTIMRTISSFTPHRRSHQRSSSDVHTGSSSMPPTMTQSLSANDYGDEGSSQLTTPPHRATSEHPPMDKDGYLTRSYPTDMSASANLPSHNPLESESSSMSMRSGALASQKQPSQMGSLRDGADSRLTQQRHSESYDGDAGLVANLARTMENVGAAFRTMGKPALYYKTTHWDDENQRLSKIAHESPVVAILSKGQYIFTSSVSGVCDAQIRMWVEGMDRENMQYGLHDTYHCRRNRAARTMTTIPWPAPPNTASNGSTSSLKSFRLLSGHDSGNILMFDPSQPFLKPILCISFAQNVQVKNISLMKPFGLLAISRSDGSMHVINCFTPESSIMNNAIDHNKPNVDDVFEELGKVELDDKNGWVFQMYDKRVDFVSVASSKGAMVSGTARGAVMFWPPAYIEAEAQRAGLTLRKVENSLDLGAMPSVDSGHEGAPITDASKATMSVNLEDDEDLDLVEAKDIVLKRFLGDGGFGTVREGSLHHTRVAVKIIKQTQVRGILSGAIHASRQGTLDNVDIRRDLAREVRILKKVRHPNVVFFRALCLHPPMIVTELCEHGSLFDVIKLYNKPRWREKLQWRTRVNLAADAAKGMAYLHQRKLLHCDLKSLNLLVHGSDLVCKVADFGLSRYLTGKQDAKSSVGPAANNPMWQAPEVARDPENCSKAGDVYAFGIIMWELLMMQPPWQGMHLALIGAAVQDGERPEVPEDLTTIPGSTGHRQLPCVDEYIELMRECWAQDPAARPTFDTVVQRLEDIIMSLSGSEQSTQGLNQLWSVREDAPPPRSLRNTMSLPNSQSLPPTESFMPPSSNNVPSIPEGMSAPASRSNPVRARPAIAMLGEPSISQAAAAAGALSAANGRANRYLVPAPKRPPQRIKLAASSGFRVGYRPRHPHRRVVQEENADDMDWTIVPTRSLPGPDFLDDAEAAEDFSPMSSDGDQQYPSTHRHTFSMPEGQRPARHVAEAAQMEEAHADLASRALAAQLSGRTLAGMRASSGAINVPSLSCIAPSSFSVEPSSALYSSLVTNTINPGPIQVAAEMDTIDSASRDMTGTSALSATGPEEGASQKFPPIADKVESIVFLQSGKPTAQPVQYPHSHVLASAPTVGESASVNRITRPTPPDPTKAPGPSGLGARAAEATSPLHKRFAAKPSRLGQPASPLRANGSPSHAAARSAAAMTPPQTPSLASPFDVEPASLHALSSPVVPHAQGNDAVAPTLPSPFFSEPPQAAPDRGVPPESSVRAYAARSPVHPPPDANAHTAPALASPFDWEPPQVRASGEIPGQAGAARGAAPVADAPHAPVLPTLFDVEPSSASRNLVHVNGFGGGPPAAVATAPAPALPPRDANPAMASDNLEVSWPELGTHERTNFSTQYTLRAAGDVHAPSMRLFDSSFDSEPLAASQDLSGLGPPLPVVSEEGSKADAVAPKLFSSFDREPPAARSQALPDTNAASTAFANGHGEAVAPKLLSSFDQEPRTVRGEPTSDAKAAAADAVAPTLVSSFSQEPAAAARQAAAGGRAADAVAPQLVSSFDQEPAAVRVQATSGTAAATADAVAPTLPSSFTQEPAAAARLAASDANATPVAFPGADSVAPKLFSSFDQEPAAARSHQLSGTAYPIIASSSESGAAGAQPVVVPSRDSAEESAGISSPSILTAAPEVGATPPEEHLLHESSSVAPEYESAFDREPAAVSAPRNAAGGPAPQAATRYPDPSADNAHSSRSRSETSKPAQASDAGAAPADKPINMLDGHGMVTGWVIQNATTPWPQDGHRMVTGWSLPTNTSHRTTSSHDSSNARMSDSAAVGTSTPGMLGWMAADGTPLAHMPRPIAFSTEASSFGSERASAADMSGMYYGHLSATNSGGGYPLEGIGEAGCETGPWQSEHGTAGVPAETAQLWPSAFDQEPSAASTRLSSNVEHGVTLHANADGAATHDDLVAEASHPSLPSPFDVEPPFVSQQH